MVKDKKQNSRLSKHLQKGLALAMASSVFLFASGCTSVPGSTDNETVSSTTDLAEENTLTIRDLYSIEALVNHDYVLFDVLCAAPAPIRLGLMQDQADRVYNESTDYSWGYVNQDYLEPYVIDQQYAWTIAEEQRVALSNAEEDVSIDYAFDVPNGQYEVELHFTNPFSQRDLDIYLEGELADTAKAFKFESVTRRFEVDVQDTRLDVSILSPSFSQDPMKTAFLSGITVYATPEYSVEELKSLANKVSSDILDKAFVGDLIFDLEEALDEVNQLGNNDLDRDYIKEQFIFIQDIRNKLEERVVHTSFIPGGNWTDTENVFIQAHGGQVQWLTYPDKETGEEISRWWWVGEDKTHGYRGGIRAYSSDDLLNWDSEGIVMRNISDRAQLDTEEYFTSLYEGASEAEKDKVFQAINDTTSVIERPKMIYNEKTDKYIIWFHADGPTDWSDANYAAASAGIAIADHPAGPFRFIDRYRLNVCPPDQKDFYPQSKGMARDMTLFVDDDGTAYIIYSSEENLTLYISKLNEEYTYLATDPEEAVYGEDFIRVFPGAQREAPALFKRDGKYYMMTSGCTGWHPNPAKYAMADSILGTWTDMGDPMVDDVKRTTFDSQSTNIFSYTDKEGNEQFVYMGDRWMPDALNTSSYVWLPIDFDGELMSISWVDEWSIDQ